MLAPGNISIQDFSYPLPEDKIALYPLPERDASKLLIYKNGRITEDIYRNIAAHLPQDTLLIFNNTKVINARLRFKKNNGAIIEIFCLEPYGMADYSSAMGKTAGSKWKCFVGGFAKWKAEELTLESIINEKKITIIATLFEKLADAYIINFSWTPHAFSFAEIIESVGDIPLPPYIKRQTDQADTNRYQTVYATQQGSVAAPTAGLHFTQYIFEQLAAKQIEKTDITLHVGAGTFKPVKSASMLEHTMHAEWIDVNTEAIRRILNKKDNVIAVGTTSARTIETLYWLGVKCFLQPEIETLFLKQWDVYELPLREINLSVTEALQALMKWMKKYNSETLFVQTQLLITPGYTFKIIKGLVTNFHQPRSTLLLLVAAATGGNWKKIYDHALENNFRFLSYGDGNLIFI